MAGMLELLFHYQKMEFSCTEYAPYVVVPFLGPVMLSHIVDTLSIGLVNFNLRWLLVQLRVIL